MSDTMSDMSFGSLSLPDTGMPSFGGASFADAGGYNTGLSVNDFGQRAYDLPVEPPPPVEVNIPPVQFTPDIVPSPIITDYAFKDASSPSFLSPNGSPSYTETVQPLLPPTLGSSEQLGFAPNNLGPNSPAYTEGFDDLGQPIAVTHDPNTGGSTDALLGTPLYSSALQATPEQEIGAAKSAISIGANVVQAGIGALEDDPAKVGNAAVGAAVEAIKAAPNFSAVAGDWAKEFGFGPSNPQGSLDASVINQGIQNAVQNPDVPGTLQIADIPQSPLQTMMVGGTN